MVRNRSCRGRDSSSRVGGVSGTLVSSPRMERKSIWSGTGSVEGEQFLQGGERQRHCSSSSRMERRGRWSGTGSVEGEKFLKGGERQRRCSFFVQDGERR